MLRTAVANNGRVPLVDGRWATVEIKKAANGEEMIHVDLIA
jgi:hypothetical protein